ncbi:hypothetical protein IFM89_021443 [Coptis chinensis]|uniref:SWIM-type domain-containing protein n=1 Tax=Coptis chinensis TaxID=261450 RepID=A0A835J1A8_9MAGN|nr:hypothetical protein IFM89_021443 [Coptis chinensis]
MASYEKRDFVIHYGGRFERATLSDGTAGFSVDKYVNGKTTKLLNVDGDCVCFLDFVSSVATSVSCPSDAFLKIVYLLGGVMITCSSDEDVMLMWKDLEVDQYGFSHIFAGCDDVEIIPTPCALPPPRSIVVVDDDEIPVIVVEDDDFSIVAVEEASNRKRIRETSVEPVVELILDSTPQHRRGSWVKMEEVDISNIEAEEEYHSNNSSSEGESDDEFVLPQGGGFSKDADNVFANEDSDDEGTRLNAENVANELGENEVLPRVKKLIAKYVKLINNYIVRGSSTNHVYMVRTQYGTRWEVNLVTKECSCIKWQLSGLPCVHAMAVLHPMRCDWVDYTHPYMSVRAYKETYAGSIRPMADLNDWDKNPKFPEGDPQGEPIIVLPPPFVRGIGRPKKNRKRAPDEPAPTGKVRHCKRCNGTNHNSRTCKGVPAPKKKYTKKDKEEPIARAQLKNSKAAAVKEQPIANAKKNPKQSRRHQQPIAKTKKKNPKAARTTQKDHDITTATTWSNNTASAHSTNAIKSPESTKDITTSEDVSDIDFAPTFSNNLHLHVSSSLEPLHHLNTLELQFIFLSNTSLHQPNAMILRIQRLRPLFVARPTSNAKAPLR